METRFWRFADTGQPPSQPPAGSMLSCGFLPGAAYRKQMTVFWGHSTRSTT